MRKMGGLKKFVLLTYSTMLILNRTLGGILLAVRERKRDKTYICFLQPLPKKDLSALELKFSFSCTGTDKN